MARFFIPSLYIVLQITVVAALGFFLRRSKGRWGGDFFSSFSAMVVKVTLPIYFFVKFSQASLEDLKSAWMFPLAGPVIPLVGMGLSLIVLTLFRLRGNERRTAAAIGSFGNSGYIPITIVELLPLALPAVAASFGTDLPLLFIGSYLLTHSPLLWSFGRYLVTGSADKPKLKDFISPPLLGILAGLTIPLLGLKPVFFDSDLPFWYIHSALAKVSNITFPAILLCLGAIIGELKINGVDRIRKRQLLSSTAAVMIVRYLLMPGIFYGVFFAVFKPLQVPPPVIWVFFLETHIPPANNFAVMAKDSGRNEDITAFALLITYLAYLVVLPVSMLLFLTLMQ
ncbi:MAG: AEC family transporter [Spirochaetia bacterium]